MNTTHHTADLIIYGGTPAGVIAAVTAARRGASVILLENTRHVGGLSTSGLNTSEVEHMLPESWGGIQNELYIRLGKRYGLDAPLHRWESHAAEAVFLEMLDLPEITIVYDAWIDAAQTDNGRIQSITMTDGQTYAGQQFIDASYEGDLAQLAGVSMTYGREAKTTYNESLAGQRFIEDPNEVAQYGAVHTIDQLIEAKTTDADGNLLPSFVSMDEINVGEADQKVMNYNFRVTVSSAADRVPFQKPDGYRPDDFANIAEWLHQIQGEALANVMGVMDHPSGRYEKDGTSLDPVIDTYAHPSGQYHDTPDGLPKPIKTDKWELNNKQSAVWSLGHFGAQFGWPGGTHDERRAIWEEHKRHNLGLLYFLANDPAVPAPLRENANRFGLAADEYTDHDHWPYYLYIREARRMVGDYVMTQHDIIDTTRKNDVVMLGSHWIDCHHVQRVAVSPTHFRNEGRIWFEVTEPYDIPYRCLIPKGEQCTNLHVPVCVSASHVAFCSIRLESVWMLLGQATAEAACLALEHDTPLQETDIQTLQSHLTQSGVPLRK